MKLRGREIIVIGATGFIGRYVVARLAREGARVRVGARHPGRALFLRSYGEVGQIAPVACDVKNPGMLARVIAGMDSVVYLPGVLYSRGKQTFDAIHKTGPGVAAQAASQAGAKWFVHMSALGARTDSPSRYGRSKGEGEEVVRRQFPQATILRPSVVFGAEDQFLNRFASMALLSYFIPVIGGGETRMQPVFVGDVAQAVLRCLLEPEKQGHVYELGGPEIYTYRRLMVVILSIIQRRRLLVNIPWRVASLVAYMAALLPRPVVTVDQLAMLREDNIVGLDAAGFNELGVRPASVEVAVPSYLKRFRPGGHWSAITAGGE